MTYQLDFENIYHSSPDMCISLDIESGKIISCNQTLVDVLGFSMDECLAMNALDFYHPDYHGKVKENLKALSINGKIVNTEFVLVKKNGDSLEVDLQFSIIKDSNGRGLYSNAVWRDISKIKKAENDLREEKAKVEYQKSLIEEKNKDILASIVYAKRIQTAILPPIDKVKELLPESFVLYKPKDIVAGDFYWIQDIDDGVLFAVADCTGHGVPGALVSVICNGALNSSVREFGLCDPGLILDKARELVIQGFEKTEEEIKDGMDISLCKLSGNTLWYAGANNPLWIVRDGQVLETKADKQSIGRSAKCKYFATHKIELQKRDNFYLFSDGFQDQFGGTERINGRKYMTKRFKEFLISIQDQTMDDQHELLSLEFDKWKGDFEQVDDVSIIGVKMP